MRSNNGFGFNPISLSEIRAYIDLEGKPYYDIHIFVSLIMETDKEYLSLANKKP